jgi:monovalent cation/hydrogen antiporter
MPAVQLTLGLMVAVALLALLARRLRMPYPIVLVLGGLVLGFVPWLPRVEMAPEVVFLVFLPPLLFKAAWGTSMRDFRAHLRSISLLAFGLVLCTTVGVAVVAHLVVPGLPWATAFVLGAVVSPTDAVAATAIMRRLGAPRQVIAIVEGESLINDASGLVAFRLALVAATTGGIALWQAGPMFVVVVGGGIAVGLAVGWLLAQIQLRINDPLIEITLSFMAAYAAYLAADSLDVSGMAARLAGALQLGGEGALAAAHLNVSGVLAVVVAGLYVGRRSPELLSPETRMQGIAVWETAEFALNGLAFILVGLQLPSILDGLQGLPMTDLLLYGAIVSLAVVAIRILWTFPGAYLPFLLPWVRRRERFPPAPNVTITAWSGMHGAVSLAAALSVPATLAGGAQFGGRDLILFLTFSVILVTLVLQGLSLPAVMRWVGAAGDGSDRHEEKVARLHAIVAAEQRLAELAEEEWAHREQITYMRGYYTKRRKSVEARFGIVRTVSAAAPAGGGDGPAPPAETLDERRRRHESMRRLKLELVSAERLEVVRLRNQGAIGDGVMHRIEHDLDLEELRLAEAPA